MKFSLLLALAASGTSAASACDSSSSPDDSTPAADAAPYVDCNPDSIRSTHTADVSGQVIDFVTLDSIDNALIDFTTAWDTDSFAPLEECGVIDSFRTASDGTFGPETLEVGSRLDPPIVLFEVSDSDSDRARTASDQTLTCDAPAVGADTSVCRSPPHLIRAPSAALATAWRTELAARGVPFADDRGLVVFEFREDDGTPAAGVTATLYSGLDAEELTPGLEVHYLAADRASLAPSTTTETTASGVAIISVSTDIIPVTAIGGNRDHVAAWDATGVLVMPGYLFLEDRRVTTE